MSNGQLVQKRARLNDLQLTWLTSGILHIEEGRGKLFMTSCSHVHTTLPIVNISYFVQQTFYCYIVLFNNNRTVL